MRRSGNEGRESIRLKVEDTIERMGGNLRDTIWTSAQSLNVLATHRYPPLHVDGQPLNAQTTFSTTPWKNHSSFPPLPHPRSTNSPGPPNIPLDVLQPNLIDDEIPIPKPEAPPDTKTTAIASILKMIPEVDPDHLLALVEAHLPMYGPNRIVSSSSVACLKTLDTRKSSAGREKGKRRPLRGPLRVRSGRLVGRRRGFRGFEEA